MIFINFQCAKINSIVSSCRPDSIIANESRLSVRMRFHHRAPIYRIGSIQMEYDGQSRQTFIIWPMDIDVGCGANERLVTQAVSRSIYSAFALFRSPGSST